MPKIRRMAALIEASHSELLVELKIAERERPTLRVVREDSRQ